jgi:glycosyltransferase involved in cell wall biosynthesis
MSKKLSIITITYQAELYLERTIQRVISQKGLEQIEYILVDGGSTDQTMDIVSRYKNYFHTIISEKDQGIYDAMNKGIKASTGDYLIFMNAGDCFASDQTLEKILKDLDEQPDVLYGETQYVDMKGTVLGLRSELTPQILPQQATWKDFKYGMVICHQSFIVKRSIAPLFNLQYKLSSDVDWEIKCLKIAQKIKKTDQPIANYLMGGASVTNLKKSWSERFEVLQTHFGLIPTILNHVFIIFRGLMFAIKKKGKYW